MSLFRQFGAAVSRAQEGVVPARAERAGRAYGLAVLVRAEVAIEAANLADVDNRDNNSVEVTPEIQRILDLIDAAGPQVAGVGGANQNAQAQAAGVAPILVEGNAGSCVRGVIV